MTAQLPPNFEALVEVTMDVEALLWRMASDLEFFFAHAPEPHRRTAILIGVLRRAVNASKAIRLLRDQQAFYEDAFVLTRSLVETIVSGVYLQIADDNEVNAYVTFDVIPVVKMLRFIESSAPQEFAANLGGSAEKAFAREADRVKAATSKTTNEFGWTKLKLPERAERIDRKLGHNGFTMLARGVFPVGHAFVHGNYSSIRGTLPYAPTAGVVEAAPEPLYLSTLALLALAASVNTLRNCHADQKLAEIGSALNAYGNVALGHAREVLSQWPT